MMYRSGYESGSARSPWALALEAEKQSSWTRSALYRRDRPTLSQLVEQGFTPETIQLLREQDKRLDMRQILWGQEKRSSLHQIQKHWSEAESERAARTELFNLLDERQGRDSRACREKLTAQQEAKQVEEDAPQASMLLVGCEHHTATPVTTGQQPILSKNVEAPISTEETGFLRLTLKLAVIDESWPLTTGQLRKLLKEHRFTLSVEDLQRLQVDPKKPQYIKLRLEKEGFPESKIKEAFKNTKGRAPWLWLAKHADGLFYEPLVIELFKQRFVSYKSSTERRGLRSVG
jgi:hypothetical protein